jgi:hypothetical protein
MSLQLANAPFSNKKVFSLKVGLAYEEFIFSKQNILA